MLLQIGVLSLVGTLLTLYMLAQQAEVFSWTNFQSHTKGNSIDFGGVEEEC